MNKTIQNTPSKHLQLLHLKIIPIDPKWTLPTTNLWVQTVSFPGCTLQGTSSYPTKRGKGKLASKVPWDRTCSFPGRFSQRAMIFFGDESLRQRIWKTPKTNIILIPWILYQSNICVTIQIYIWSKINNHQVIFGPYFCNNSTTHLKKTILH